MLKNVLNGFLQFVAIVLLLSWMMICTGGFNMYKAALAFLYTYRRNTAPIAAVFVLALAAVEAVRHEDQVKKQTEGETRYQQWLTDRKGLDKSTTTECGSGATEFCKSVNTQTTRAEGVQEGK